MALGPQIVLVSDGLKIVARHPGGAKGTRLKSCGPSKTWYLVLDFSYLFYPFLIPLPLTFVLSIVFVVVVVSGYLVSPLPSSLSLVFALGSIPSLPCNHLNVFCVALSLKRRLLFVPCLSQYWLFVSSSWYLGGISILCGIHCIRMSINMRGYCAFSLY